MRRGGYNRLREYLAGLPEQYAFAQTHQDTAESTENPKISLEPDSDTHLDYRETATNVIQSSAENAVFASENLNANLSNDMCYDMSLPSSDFETSKFGLGEPETTQNDFEDSSKKRRRMERSPAQPWTWSNPYQPRAGAHLAPPPPARATIPLQSDQPSRLSNISKLILLADI